MSHRLVMKRIGITIKTILQQLKHFKTRNCCISISDAAVICFSTFHYKIVKSRIQIELDGLSVNANYFSLFTNS